MQTETDWRDKAACKGLTDIMFAAEAPGGGHKIAVKRAKKVCAQCSVVAECAKFAADEREPYGIWGGLTPKERGITSRKHHHPVMVEAMKHRIQGHLLAVPADDDVWDNTVNPTENRERVGRVAKRRRLLGDTA